MRRAIGVEPTKLTAATSGCSSRRSTATRSPCTTLNTPSGSPASCQSSATRIDTDGSFSDGLSTKQFPAAMAIGYIHIGTMIGKLNGVMPATTPNGCRNRIAVDVRRDVLGKFSLDELGNAARELHHLERALHLAARIGEHLPVLAHDDARELVGGAGDELAKSKKDGGTLGER